LAKKIEKIQESSLFSTLFNLITSKNYFYQNVCVEIKKSETRLWILIYEELESKLLLIKILGFMYLKYILLSYDIAASLLPLIQFSNALTRLIDFRHQFLIQKYEDIHDILLYNHII